MARRIARTAFTAAESCSSRSAFAAVPARRLGGPAPNRAAAAALRGLRASTLPRRATWALPPRSSNGAPVCHPRILTRPQESIP